MNAIQGPVHLIGIGGIHMSAIGELLLAQGIAVSGSDLRPSALTAKLERLGARVETGHSAEHIGDAAMVVTTAAADDANPEIAEARRRGIPVLLRAEMVGRLVADRRVIAVAGSHGKTTTSSLIAFVLREAELRPMYLLGGESRDLGGHAAWGGPLCVVEADEYKRAFHEYQPWLGIVLNVEADHLDYYGTPDAYEEAFVVFGQRIVEDGLLLACGDDPGARRVAGQVAHEGLTTELYGIDGDGLTWAATDLEHGSSGTAFTVVREGARLGEVWSRLPGRHGVLMALAATAACTHAGVDFAAIVEAVGRFTGATRRFETLGEARGVVVMDDYAHHPSEVRATLSAARERFGDRRLIVVHQPHTYSRVAYLWDDWLTCWEDADRLIIAETYAARETPDRGKSAKDLADALRDPVAEYAATFEEAARMAAESLQAGDVVITIGAGDVREVGEIVLELLR